MENITKNEMLFALTILKSPETAYNANSIARHIGITSMGALKIARRLERDKIIVSRELGKARFYMLNFQNTYATEYAKFLLRREAEHAPAYARAWISELRKLKNAYSAVLFGSVLRENEKANDIDVLLITDKRMFQKLKKEVEDINFVNAKKIHPVYQTREDMKKNIKKRDKVVLNAIKGIVASGEDEIINLLEV